MLRFVPILPILLFLSACASGGPMALPADALRQARQDIQLREEVRHYSHFAVARYASLTDDPAIAAENYAEVARLAPGDLTIAERAVFSALLIGDVDDAARLARRIPDTTLNETELARLTLAIDAVANNHNTKALTYLEQPWNSTYHAVLARSIAAWIAIGNDPDRAIELQAGAAGDDPVLSGVSQNLGAIMQLNAGETAQAKADLEQLWQAGARLAIGVEAHTRLMALAGETDAAQNRLRDFRELVGRHPALTALAREIEAGAVAPTKTLTQKQGMALAVYAATAALANQNESDLPGVYFALALHLDPDLDAARTLWADTLDKANRREEAIALLQTVPPGSLYHTNAQGQLAWALRREGRNDEALQIAQFTLERTEDRNIRIQLADLLQSLGRDGEAEAAFTEIIQADEANGLHDWRIYYARGAARERLGRWPPAEDDLKAALGLKPDSPAIMNYLGYGWIARGTRLDDGLRLIENALRLEPSNGAYTDSLGWAHYKLGNYDRAVFYLERATELAPQNAEILDHLGDIYWQIGRYTEAGYQWQRAIGYSNDSEAVDLIQQKIDGGFALLTAGNTALVPSAQ